MCIRDRDKRTPTMVQRQISLRSQETTAYAAYRKENLVYGINKEDCRIENVDIKKRILTFSCRPKDANLVQNKLEQRVHLHVRSYEYPRGPRAELGTELRERFHPFVRFYSGRTLGLNSLQLYLFAEERNKDALDDAMQFLESYKSPQREREERKDHKKFDEEAAEEEKEKDGASTSDRSSTKGRARMIGGRKNERVGKVGGGSGTVRFGGDSPKTRGKEVEEKRDDLKRGTGRISSWIQPPEQGCWLLDSAT
eukprot:TRINITY_DN3077_c0_g1_i1.p1 TRINITY_DN3077_c0_g1~~TRINITY_DN3077_c0_g1_i1.p1  ORF type:complete len:253 (-),score=53.42 TRINITY_DN3077_c0_g1_i1:278-1036(-)